MQDTLSSSQEAPSNMSLREYGDILRRRRAIILQTFVIVLVIGILLNLYTPYIYSTSARILTEAPRFQINNVNASDPLNELFSVGPQYSLMTQVQMLQRGDLQKTVAQKLGVASIPTITVKPVEGTQIIELSAEGDDPQLLASSLNMLMEAYTDEVRKASGEKIENALKFASERAETAREAIADLTEKNNKFKNKHAIFELQVDKTVYMTRVNSLTDEYEKAKSDMQALVGRIGATNDALRAQQRTISPFVSSLGDPRIQSIDDELVKLDAALKAQEAAGFKLNGTTPQIQQLRVQIQRLNQRKDELLRTYAQRNAVPNPEVRLLGEQVAAQNIELITLQKRTQDIVRRLQEAQTRLKNFPNWEREWTKTQGDLDKALKDYDYFSTQENNLHLRQEVLSSGPKVMQKAPIPSRPIRPNREQNILFAAILGIFFGLCLALVQELFDDRINSPEEAERVLRLPSLGLIPLIEEEGLRLIKDTTKFSPLTESYRSLRTNINFASVGHQIRSIVITSSVPAEGKSTTVANLAMAMAMERKRVIIVDADLRRPSLHKLFRIESSPGLTDVLVGTHAIEDVLHDTSVPGVQVIAAGSPPPNPAELLGSPEMGEFIATLEEMCDRVLFDSPPSLLVADSIVLASRADGVLLVIGYGETKKANTRKAIEMLSRANTNMLGTVLNRMEGQGGGYYYGKYYVPVSDRSATPANGNASLTAGPHAPLGGNESQPSLTSSNEKAGNETE